jgi:hypothetical protein
MNVFYPVVSIFCYLFQDGHWKTFKKKLGPEIQVRMHNMLSKSAMMYGSETWILRSQGGRRIETSQMRFLREVAGVTLRDRIRSEDVRKILQTEMW